MASKLIGERERYHRSFCPDSNIIVVGIPNVGKSSLINLIRGGFLKVKSRPLKVGDKPGVTRALQTKIRVSDDPLIFLLDTPGIMMPNIKNLETGMKLSACGKYFLISVFVYNYHPDAGCHRLLNVAQ